MKKKSLKIVAITTFVCFMVITLVVSVSAKGNKVPTSTGDLTQEANRMSRSDRQQAESSKILGKAFPSPVTTITE
ncbi:hypothetical protein MKX42_10265 [Paenibacillus sp. FSL R7-0204]|uniref:hypothetical protein n=1 Tax=Paenibacillus sp. FSL R7-0204 TaxID=2921675 RepID=UPI0030FC40BE